MKISRHEQLVDLFNRARGLSPDDRASFLDDSCGDDFALRREVESLLDEDSRGSSVLETDVLKHHVADVARSKTASPPSSTPETIGRYAIARIIGRGGMGVVYEAQQDHPQRTVALKVINPGVASASLLRRFDYEADVLGRLQHPGIAQIYDAGTYDGGAGAQPYFAMELVEGPPLTTYARLNDLRTRGRLELMASIADAVQHAHERGVIHRDLKPANILVSAKGQPKILDFGVARATEADMRTTTLRTNIGELIGTVPYMSPEQAGGRAADLDTRSDVYALGILTYELLTERLPYDVSDVMVHEAVRIIREQTPAPISTINKTLGGDIETIIGKALAKEPAERYQSAAAFADDIRRFLTDQPILARPPSTWYRVRKFTRRHRGLVAATAAIFTILSGAVIMTTISRQRAIAARDDAQRDAQTANEVTDFLVELFDVPDPGESRGRSITAQDSLDRGAERIDRDLDAQPEVQSRLMMTMGRVYEELGLYDDAAPLDERSLEVRRVHHGAMHPAVLESMAQLSSLRFEQGDYDRAMQLSEESLALARELHAPPHESIALALNNCGWMASITTEYDRAEQLHREALAMRRELFSGDHDAITESMENLAVVLTEVSRTDESIPLLEEVLAMRRRMHGEDHPLVSRTWGNLAVAHEHERNLEAAVAAIERAIMIDRQTGSPELSTSLVNCARMLQRLGRPDDAVPLVEEAIAIDRRVRGDNHEYVAYDISVLASIHAQRGDAAQAETKYREAIDIYTANLPESEGFLAVTLGQLGTLLLNEDRADEAEPILRRAAAIRLDSYGPTHRRTIQMNVFHARALIALEQFDEAETILLRCHEVNTEHHPEATERDQTIREQLVALYEARGDAEQAARWASEQAAGE